ncbi:MAG: hypothetical protein IRY90_21345 [Actinomadura rubrobrunea]|nr:hypothetical protein [Actinomadura rubrobrunea]
MTSTGPNFTMSGMDVICIHGRVPRRVPGEPPTAAQPVDPRSRRIRRHRTTAED